MEVDLYMSKYGTSDIAGTVQIDRLFNWRALEACSQPIQEEKKKRKTLHTDKLFRRKWSW